MTPPTDIASTVSFVEEEEEELAAIDKKHGLDPFCRVWLILIKFADVLPLGLGALASLVVMTSFPSN